MGKSPKPKVPSGAVSSLPNFLERIAALKAPHKDGFYTFRGINDCLWDLEAGLMRKGREELLAHEKDAIRELIAVQPQQFSEDTSMFDKLVRMQHFEMPTRILDVTANPLVALYFASSRMNDPTSNGAVECIFVPFVRKKYFDSDTISCIANLANLSEAEKSELYKNLPLTSKKSFNGLPSTQRLLQSIRSEKPYFLEEIVGSDLNKLWFVLPKMNNARIIAQQGAFLIFGLTPLQRVTGKSLTSISMIDIEVDDGSKEKIREGLDVLGINERSLFPEIDKAARYIAESYR